MPQPLKFAAIGIDHGHIFGMADGMLAAGAEFAGWWSAADSPQQAQMRARFPDVLQATEMEQLLDDPSIALVLTASVPDLRAEHAILAMEAGKDVMADKPGCTSRAQLDALRGCVARTGRIWSVNFSERLRVASAAKAGELVQAGAIGEVVNIVGLGPHRLRAATRPDWFFERPRYGGILVDIAAHQIDQFLHFTGSATAEVTMASVANRSCPEHPGLQDFGELALRSGHATGYARVDWLTPDGLPVWGDGRLTILGTEGYVELRKYIDLGHGTQGDNLFLVTRDRCERVDCRGTELPYSAALIADIRDRSETAMSQAHAFEVTTLALEAQALAEKGTRWEGA
ncbi:Gfo/Idh/MocA family protein [Mangrovicoccus sp. HB161399]|uniref:Gfo/Idh/MocA family protein n=1 Tax=Mangrovicoccus sp. HB161399 TaxID=2720392 RepID=UPI001551F8E8|nr:Gfo/Idh/MocA family oxidoreductase [Mangrovicoccus sp. HB161399]